MLSRLRLKVPFPVAAATASAALAAILHWSPAGEAIATHVSHRFLFWARAAIGQGPGLDPHVKIFSFDDPTASKLQSLDIPLSDWAMVFRALDARKPRGVYVDKLFDRPYAPEEIDAFRAALAGTTTPIVVDTFVGPDKIPFRAELPLDRPYHVPPPAMPRWLKARPAHHYGPSPALAPAFFGLGHAVYDARGMIEPVIALADGGLVPHWSLFAAESWSLDAKSLIVSGHRVPVDADGRLLVNVDQRKAYSGRALSMLPLVELARRGGAITPVNEGDLVVILPAMYTGNTDWRETPLGSLQGGYIMTALLHSALTGAWLDRIDDRGLTSAAYAALGAFFAMKLAPLALIGALAGVMLATVGGAAAAFTYGGLVFPWILPLLALLLTAALVIADRFRRAQREQARMERELETAQLVQNSFFPPPDPAPRGGLIVDGFYRPASECGGDFWGHFSPRPGIEYLMIGDATGHGVPAALVTAMSYSALMTMADMLGEESRLEGPARLLARFNRVLLSTRGGEVTMTLFIAMVDTAARTMTFSNAGHNFPYIIPKTPGANGKKHQALTVTSGTPLGLGLDAVFTERTAPFLPGDRLFLYTDGLIENAPGKGGAPLGKRGLRQLIDDVVAMPFAAVRPEAIARMDKVLDGAPLEDDVTVVAVEFTNPA